MRTFVAENQLNNVNLLNGKYSNPNFFSCHRASTRGVGRCPEGLGLLLGGLGPLLRRNGGAV